MTESPAGGLPLGFIVLSGQKEESLDVGFKAIKKLMPDGAFGERGAEMGQELIMTDGDSVSILCSPSLTFSQPPTHLGREGPCSTRSPNDEKIRQNLQASSRNPITWPNLLKEMKVPQTDIRKSSLFHKCSAINQIHTWRKIILLPSNRYKCTLVRKRIKSTVWNTFR